MHGFPGTSGSFFVSYIIRMNNGDEGYRYWKQTTDCVTGVWRRLEFEFTKRLKVKVRCNKTEFETTLPPIKDT